MELFRNSIRNNVCSVCIKIALVGNINEDSPRFCCLGVDLHTIKIPGQSDKFPLRFLIRTISNSFVKENGLKGCIVNKNTKVT